MRSKWLSLQCPRWNLVKGNMRGTLDESAQADNSRSATQKGILQNAILDHDMPRPLLSRPTYPPTVPPLLRLPWNSVPFALLCELRFVRHWRGFWRTCCGAYWLVGVDGNRVGLNGQRGRTTCRTSMGRHKIRRGRLSANRTRGRLDGESTGRGCRAVRGGVRRPCTAVLRRSSAQTPTPSCMSPRRPSCSPHLTLPAAAPFRSQCERAGEEWRRGGEEEREKKAWRLRASVCAALMRASHGWRVVRLAHVAARVGVLELSGPRIPSREGFGDPVEVELTLSRVHACVFLSPGTYCLFYPFLSHALLSASSTMPTRPPTSPCSFSAPCAPSTRTPPCARTPYARYAASRPMSSSI